MNTFIIGLVGYAAMGALLFTDVGDNVPNIADGVERVVAPIVESHTSNIDRAISEVELP